MSKNKTHLSCRHPKVLLIHDSDEDILGAATIIAEQEQAFRAIHHDDSTRKIIFDCKPSVFLLAMNSVTESIELYAELVADMTITHVHQAILLCKNKESGVAFRSCVRGLFDNYFVYQPLYEKFRLKMIVHSALVFTASTSKYVGLQEEQLETIEEELSELIDKGGECKQQLLGSIQSCKAEIKLAANDVERTHSDVEKISPKALLEQVTKSHVEPLLDNLEKELMASLGGLMATLIDNHKRHQDNRAELSQKVFKEPLAGTSETLNSETKQPLETQQETVETTNPIEEQNEKSILIVEDNELYREMLFNVLVQNKYRVDSAQDGLQALRLLKRNRYDCVLMDLYMPKLDGLNTTKQLKKISGGELPPIIALTGNKRKDLVRRWAAFGLRGYIVKPSSKEEIIGAVSKVTNGT